MMKRSIFPTALLALLFMGSASLWAQTGDSFGEVDGSHYSNNMNITGYVRFVQMVNGEWVPVNDEVLGNQTVVAAYCGGELRGKASPEDFPDAQISSLLMMTVYGETKGQPLYFKVFTEGRVIEVNQGLVFNTDARIGKVNDPYYINLPLPVSTTFSTEGWATTCLPFEAQVPDGVTLYNATDIKHDTDGPGELVMEKVEASVLPANIPVLLQSTAATCEWLAKVVDTETLETQAALFNVQSSILKGTTEPTDVATNSVLTLGHANSDNGDIGFWLYTGTSIPANRAYIADFPSNTNCVRIVNPDCEATGISELRTANGQQPTAIYDLQGRRMANGHSSMVNGQSLKKGVYIVNGNKIVNR